MTEPHDGDIGGDLPPLDAALAAWLATDASPPMPGEVWARIEERLAAEPPLVPAEVVDLGAERSARRPQRVLPLLAGAAGLVLVGVVVVPALRSADPAPVADAPLASTPAEAAAAAPATSPPATVPAAPRALVASGTDYTADGLQTQAVSLLTSAGMRDSNSIAAAMTSDPDVAAMGGPGLMANPESLAACLTRLGLPEGSVPLVVDTATVNGRTGSLIVTCTEANPASVHVVAVGQDCTDADAAAALHWDVALP